MRILDIDVPKYFVTHIGKADQLAGNCIRLTMCVQRGDALEPRYACIWPIIQLPTRNEIVALVGNGVLSELATH
jgi:hypothetical protein